MKIGDKVFARSGFHKFEDGEEIIFTGTDYGQEGDEIIYFFKNDQKGEDSLISTDFEIVGGSNA